MSSFWGNKLHISIFGESHGSAIGVVIDSPPPGEQLDHEMIAHFMERRAPGRTPWSTPRKESDIPEILSGYFNDHTTGTPLTAMIRNSDMHSRDYENLAFIPRPGHADLTGSIRYKGYNDLRGGGHFSGRLTAPICYAGAVSLQILQRKGIQIYARIKEIEGISDSAVDMAHPPLSKLSLLQDKVFPTLDDAAGLSMIQAVEKARMEEDSVGGIVECFIFGLPAGIGDPMFGGLEPKLASMLYAIPAVKALSFGSGFDACRMRASVNNDSPYYSDQRDKRSISYRTNHSGGIDGGISNGMPVVFQIGIKPTPSISREQDSVSLTEKIETKLHVKGRHDPCIVPRAVPVAEAAAAIVLLDTLMDAGWFGGRNE